jgi:DNA-binding transcriptional LysR family regulator
MALCETLNFARAAELCHVSQPSLTRAVQKLERELGGLLIRRERRRTHLTELGELVRPMLQQVLSHSLHVKAAAQRHLHRTRAVLRLGIVPSIGLVRLAPCITQFCAENVDVELTLAEVPSPRLVDVLLGEDLDLTISYTDRPDKRFRYYSLYRERIVIVAPKGHRFEHVEAVRLSDLQNENLLFCTNCDMGEALLENCRKQGFEPRIIYQSAREDWVQVMVASGFGVAAMPEFTHTDVTTVARPLAEPEFIRQLSLVAVAGRPHPPAAASLIRIIRAHCGHVESTPTDSERRLPLIRYGR